MNEYSALKAAWWQSEINTMRAGGQAVPRQVHFVLSDFCNQDCHFCAYRMSTGFTNEQFPDEDGRANPHRRIPKEKAVEILDDLRSLGVQAVQFTGGGEPTAHPDHVEIFDHAQRLGLRTALVTNGLVLREEAEHVYSKFDWIRVSVDAGYESTYAAVRRVPVSQFERVIDNIECMSSWCVDTVLGVGFVVTRENYLEILQAANRLSLVGADNMRVTAMFSREGMGYYDPEMLEEIRSQIRKAKWEYGDFVVDLFGLRSDDLDAGAPDYDFCGYQQMCTYIGGDQKVYRCCSTAYTKHGEVGDLSEQSFKEWFHSQEKWDAYQNFNARSCQVCQFNDKNKVISYFMSRPTHVEFV